MLIYPIIMSALFSQNWTNIQIFTQGMTRLNHNKYLGAVELIKVILYLLNIFLYFYDALQEL